MNGILLQNTKTLDKQAMLNGVRFVEDFRHIFKAHKKALSIIWIKPLRKKRKSSLQMQNFI